MKKVKPKTQSFTNQELQDIWSSLAVMLDGLRENDSPQSVKDFKKLIIKVKGYLK